MKSTYDIFISYRRTDSGDKAEHLKDLLEPKFRGRISFDRENLTGLFDVSLVRRIDGCRDFLLILGRKSLDFAEEDFRPERVDLYRYLAACSQQEFGKKIEELGLQADIDYVRIEIGRALCLKGLNIIPIVPESSDSFNFSKLRLPPDIAGIQRYEAVCAQNGCQLQLQADEPAMVSADPAMMERVLHNLLGNAMHHVGEDGVFILRVVPKAGCARVEVEDHGAGIAPEDLPYIFDRYYRSRSDAGKVGTGLGLSITKAILRGHGFRFGVDSTVGKGTTFWFEATDEAGGDAKHK